MIRDVRRSYLKTGRLHKAKPRRRNDLSFCGVGSIWPGLLSSHFGAVCCEFGYLTLSARSSRFQAQRMRNCCSIRILPAVRQGGMIWVEATVAAVQERND